MAGSCSGLARSSETCCRTPPGQQNSAKSTNPKTNQVAINSIANYPYPTLAKHQNHQQNPVDTDHAQKDLENKKATSPAPHLNS
jgi:hypothetical protein